MVACGIPQQDAGGHWRRNCVPSTAPLGFVVWHGSAAALLLGVGLQVLVLWADEAQFARLYGPEPLPHHIAESADSIESVSNPETGRWVREQWRIGRASRRPSAEDAVGRFRDHYQNILKELAAARKEPSHVEEGCQMDHDCSGRAGGDTSYYPGCLQLYHEYTA